MTKVYGEFCDYTTPTKLRIKIAAYTNGSKAHAFSESIPEDKNDRSSAA
ncbi:hypothetical protein SP41_59 [Salmonella phage 41]|nr:hypothetical protein SP41_59 [Salmonella phage 41]